MRHKQSIKYAAHFLQEASRKMTVAYGCRIAQSDSQAEKWEDEAIDHLMDACTYLGIRVVDIKNED